jgi:hypothetical protein
MLSTSYIGQCVTDDLKDTVSPVMHFIQSVITCTKSEVLTAVKVQVEVFWVVTPYSVVVGYQRFEVSCYLHLQGEDSSQGLPCCNAIRCCGTIPTFRRTLLPPS